jgi:hypothetical protein
LFSVYLHAIIVDIFRPFLSTSWRATPLRSFASSRATPESIYAASVNQLKRLTLIYRIHCKLGLFSVFSHTPMLYVVNAMVYEANVAIRNGSGRMGAEWQFYLDLCLTGYQSLFGSFRAHGTAAKGILVMGLQHGIINARRAGRVVGDLKDLERRYDVLKELGDGRAHAGWIVDQELGMKDPEAAAGGSLAEQFQNLMISDDGSTDE